MKGQISRISHTPTKDYSGLYHVQGGMITDADLSEQASIARDRTDALGNDAIRDGVPAEGGVVRLQAKGSHPDIEHLPFLRPGVVYADGLRGTVRASEEIKWGEENALALIGLQTGLPNAPEVPAGGQEIVYVDIWHRPVFSTEDPRLLEVGLHGAETGFRTQVMTQIKTAPIGAAEQIESGTGAFPKKGNAEMSIGALTGEETGNPCDPCAPVIELAARLGNALFRVEVVDVIGPANKPSKVAFAWSMENAAITASRSAPPEGFAAPDHVFEHFDRTTECHRGVFANPGDRVRAEFLENVAAVHPRDHVRRWDGYAVFDFTTGKVEKELGSNASSINDGKIRITLDHFNVTVEVKERSIVAGDYWLVEIREHATKTELEDARIHLVSATPLGIEHHYTCLFRIEGGKPMPLTVAERRKVSFPPLSDIPASHVSFKNNCEKLYGSGEDSAETVQRALDKLCEISAEDIALDVDCPRFEDATTVAAGFKALCTIDADTITYDHSCTETFGNAKTVGEALDQLCGISSDRIWMRYVMDWGVLCGLQAKFDSDDGVVRVSPGALLTETGNFQITPWTTEQQFKVDDIQSLAVVKADGKPFDVAFGLMVEANGKLVPTVMDWVAPFTFMERIEACEKTTDGFFYDKVIETLPAKQKTSVGKVVGLAATGAWEKGGSRMTQSELDDVEDFVGKMTKVYAETRSDAEVQVLNKQLEDTRQKYELNAAGEALEMQRSTLGANLTGVLIKSSEALVNACKCAALWPNCPEGENLFVPLGRLTGTFDAGAPNKLTKILDMCMLTQRKQALTPRTMAYYFREAFNTTLVTQMAGHRPESDLEDLSEICCPKTEEDTGTTPGKKKYPFGYIKAEILEGSITGVAERKFFDLDNLSLEAAEIVLTGNGVDVTEVIDLEKAEGLEKLGALTLEDGIDQRLMAKEKLRPGDKAILIAKGDQAAGYLVQDRDAGRYTYEPSTEKTAPREKTLSEGYSKVETVADELQKRMDSLNGSTRLTDEKISGLAAALKALEDNVSGGEATVKTAQETAEATVKTVKEEIDALDDALIDREAKVEEFRARVTALGATTTGQLDVVSDRFTTLETRAGGIGEKAFERVAEAEKELARINTAIEAANNKLKLLNKEVETVEKERGGLLSTMRRERPISALGGEFTEAANIYAKQKIFTVGDLADAPDTVLRKLNDIGNITSMRVRKNQAKKFLGG